MSWRRVAVGVLAVGASALVLAGCDTAPWERKNASDDVSTSSPISKLRVANGSGTVDVKVGDIPNATVHREIQFNGDKPGHTHRVEGDTLVLDPCGQNDCEIDYTIVVPRGTTVTGHTGSGRFLVTGLAAATVKTGAGEIAVRDVPGEVRATTGSGRVALWNTGASVAAETGSGDITGTGLRGATAVKSGSGAIRLTTTAVTDVNADTGSGDVEVTVPQGQYRVRTRTGSGDNRVSVPDVPTAQQQIDVRTQSGNLTVRHG
ncbi:putative adhesin [Herbihabitans rhizosphaerae]|uniref:Putative adhesin n=1 Tax=Herbihabitans rhizosphaerae TaxID=1872711 RepID=A0A4Q7KR85_9PSEU|nr:DUF4097 family beta strand repeat-containing protein [Herbihabitans rhizosphaerae]RZS37862.1 putative adhesin [Herbihabitans rhizosphaerae]